MSNMEQRNLEKRGTQEAAVNPLVPPVDVVEDKDGITVRADLPGVSRENLSIGVDGDNLSIEGTVSLGETANLKPVYAEVRVAQYKRTFVLSRDLDIDKVDASLVNGVLTLRIPKREQARPRRIEVRTA